MKFSIQTSAIKAALHCSAKKDLRHYLNGVCLSFNHESVMMVHSTDGHILFSCFVHYENLGDQFNPGFDIIVPLDAIKAVKTKAENVTLESLPDGSYLLDNVRFTALDGRFPDVARVIPRPDQVYKGENRAYIDPDLLIRGRDALRVFYHDKKSDYPIQQTGLDGKGCSVMHNGAYDAVVVVMPMRVNELTYQGINRDYFQVQLKAA
jgi:hypothetical protein